MKLPASVFGFQSFFRKKPACHREALFAEAIFSEAKDCFAEKRSQ